ncbi:MAG: ribonuclease III [Gammaproteobacteria bacterium]|nr:ribonuclease III [Gammaproteobacteria bacterium]MCP5136873.1 ribonuclease III [Gammaproteobacteria bacterium]
MSRDARQPMERLARAFGHEFANRDLLEEALTHRSAAGRNNERLEFLGDSILGMVVAAELFRRRSDADEGEMSRLRSFLVRGTTLAQIARDMEIGDFLRLGSGEMKAGGHRRDSILAGTVEAILGAIYMDAGFAKAERCIQDLFADRLANLPDAAGLKDPKTRLQEWLQSNGQSLPTYDVLDVTGAQHKQHFRVACRAGDTVIEGAGRSRRKAEQAAAELMLSHFQSISQS